MEAQPTGFSCAAVSLFVALVSLIVGSDTELSIFGLRCRIADNQRRRRKSQMTKGLDADVAGQAVGRRPGQTSTRVNTLGAARFWPKYSSVTDQIIGKQVHPR